MNDVSKTIGWADKSWNPLTGCRRNCFYCYARKIATRFKGTKAFPNGFEPTFHYERLGEPLHLNKPNRIFICSAGEMFGDWIPPIWVEEILNVITAYPEHTFQILTKFPENARNYEFPSNVWFGVTITWGERGDIVLRRRLPNLRNNIKFISFEPLLGDAGHCVNLEGINWIIIGSQTQPFRPPKREWVEKIIEQARELEIPIFLKSSLKSIMGNNLIQEFPK